MKRVALLLVALGLGVAPAHALPRQRVRFERIALPTNPPGEARIGAATYDGRRWWLAGSVFTSDAVQRTGLSGAIGNVEGVHRPGLWWSDDSTHWTEVRTIARTGYGEVSELYSVAATSAGLVALGAATGGAHGNPRTVSWVLGSDAVLHEVPASFELYNGVRQIGVRTVSAMNDGWVIFGTRVNRNGSMGATAWTTSPVGEDFVIHDDDAALSSGVGEQVQGLDVTGVDHHLLAVGERFVFGAGHADTDGVAWMSSDGVAWQRWSPAGLGLGGSGAQRAQRVASEGNSLLIAGTQIDSTTHFLAWTRATADSPWRRSSVKPLGTSDDVLSNVTAALVSGGIRYVASRTGQHLRLARSDDGRVWTGVALPNSVPSGDRAKLSLAAGGGVLILGARSESGGGAWRTRIICLHFTTRCRT